MSKYHARKTPCGYGHVHASAREAKVCGELHLRLRAGEITALSVEPTYPLEPGGKPLKMGNGQGAKYRPDFVFMEAGKLVALDVKGMIVRDFPLRAALFRHCYPEIALRIVK